jgi:hypothetical protein
VKAAAVIPFQRVWTPKKDGEKQEEEEEEERGVDAYIMDKSSSHRVS